MLKTSSVVHKEFYSLEKHFEAVCNLHPHLKLLESQWRFDQELISKALQNIGSIFPHYSRHDASHSRQIIVNIERILGDKIQYLTATDTWLILEAAYNHDIGMVITQKQIQDMNTDDFHDFLVDLTNDRDHYLQPFAKNWLENKATLPPKSSAHDFFQQYLQLLAEWYRRKHPHNSGRIVRSPIEEIGLHSPRNELLPKRLFGILADICESHGDSFEDLMDKLPQAEAGMASEDCHPRYVACLLRMGDLLDVDDNRFCPVMMAMCAHNMPTLSKTHYEKHQSIQHLRMDSERIEIECVCPNPDAYEEAYNWFDWLQQEYHKQTQHWHQIVPYGELGRLPTLMTPIVKMEEPYIILEQGKKPTLKVNKDSFLNLVRGTGLYQSKFDAIREILQNAVDSTLHRIWIEHKEEFNSKKINSPFDPRLIEIYKQYPIHISLERHKEKNLTWVFKVRDQGTGISKTELKYILEVGSSFKNKEKSKRANEMPMWFRPSGAFGIGLQSAFLLADQFTLKTYSMIYYENLNITFYKEKNNVLLEKIKPSESKFGTEFSIDITVDTIPKSLSYSRDDPSRISDIYMNFDITKPDLSTIEISRIEQKIYNFFANLNIENNITEHPAIDDKVYFDEIENLIIRKIEFSEYPNYKNLCKFYFRGQRFSDLDIKINCISVEIDFYHTTSDQFLTYSREKIKDEAKNEAVQKTIKTLKKYVENKFDNFKETDKIYAAFAYIFNLSDKNFDDIDNKYKEKFLLFPIKIDNKIITLNALLEKIVSKEITNFCIVKNSSNLPFNFSLDNCITNPMAEELEHIIKYLATRNKIYYRDVDSNFGYTKIQFYENDCQPVSDEYFVQLIKNKKGYNLGSLGCRMVFPAWDEYRKLAINEKDIDWIDIYSYTSYQNDFLILPLDFKYLLNDTNFYDSSDDLNDWIYKNRKDQTVSLDQIKDLNEKLINHIKKIMSD